MANLNNHLFLIGFGDYLLHVLISERNSLKSKLTLERGDQFNYMIALNLVKNTSFGIENPHQGGVNKLLYCIGNHMNVSVINNLHYK